MSETMGLYEILSHTLLPECSIRIIRMMPEEHVNAHFHQKSAQIYTVLEHEVEILVARRLVGW